MIRKSQLRRASKKVIAANGGKIPFSSISPSGKGVKRKKRTKSERERIYGPPGYVEWIHSQPCIACGVIGFSECAHIRTGGFGRKDDWTRTIPLCGQRFEKMGCHMFYDVYRRNFLLMHPDFNAVEAAARTEMRWRAYEADA